MRVVHVSTHDITGGAARATFRLHEGLRHIGIDSVMFVCHKASTSPHVIQARSASGLARLRSRLRFARLQRDMKPYVTTRPPGLEAFDDDRACDVDLIRQLPPADLVHLHFTNGFVDHLSFLPYVRTDVPIVWTAHDMAPLTGGCHYDRGCERFTDNCGRCPQLGSDNDNDLSRRIWDRKRRALSLVRDRLHFVVASRWMQREVQRSSLCANFPVSHIPFGVDCDVFRPLDQLACRRALGIDVDAKVLLFVSDSLANGRKGLSHLLAALSQLTDVPNLVLLCVGQNMPPVSAAVPAVHLGSITNERLLAVAYNAADLFVAPSIQEAFGQTVLEAQACGIPVVGFDVGGISDIVRHESTGLLCPTGDVALLARTIRTVLADKDTASAMGLSARQTAEQEYESVLCATSHADLYRRLIGKKVLACR